MGANLQEWAFHLTDGFQTPGRAPMLDDDTGVMWVCTNGSTDSPTIYSDSSGTALTETHGHALLTFTNGRVRFWTDRTITTLDIYWFGNKHAGYKQGATPSVHELRANTNGQTFTTAIPVGNHAVSALSSVGNKGAGPYSVGVTPASNVTVRGIWVQVISAGQNLDSSVCNIGTSGLSNAFLTSQSVSAISYPGANATSIGAYSNIYTFSGTEALTFSPNSETNSAFGMLVYLDLNYGAYPLD